MSLSVGDLCTVAYADGGVRVALPIEIATTGQRGFLADFGTTGSGVPVRIRTVAEVAATVPESPHDPRLQRVVGTIVRDGSQAPLFVPLGVIPASTPRPTADSTFFVVFADTCNIQQVNGGGTTTPALYRRKPGEYDIEVITYNVADELRSLFPYQVRTYYTKGVKIGIVPGGYLREFFQIPNITVRDIIYSYSEERRDVAVQSERTTSFNTNPATTRLIAPPPYLGTNQYWSYELSQRYLVAVSDYLGTQTIYPLPTQRNIAERPVTWISDDSSFPNFITRLRNNLSEWPDLPRAIVYHLPRASDALPSTLNEILPQGVTDTEPLEIIRGNYPSAADVVSRIASRVTGDAMLDVRFFTAMATVGGQARVQELIDSVVGSLQNSYGEIVHSVTIAPGNDWLGALADSAEDIPDA